MIAKWLEQNTWKISWQNALATVVTVLFMLFFVMPMNGFSKPEAQNKRFPEQYGNVAPRTENEEIKTSDNPQAQFELETMILEVSGETDLACENLEMNAGHPGASFAECDGINIEGKNYFDLDTMLQGLSNISGVKILSRKKMVTPDNKTATINIGSDGAAGLEGMESLQFEITLKILEDGRINQLIYLSTRMRSNNGLASMNEAKTEIVTSKEGRILATGVPFRNYQQNGKYILILMTSKELDESGTQKNSKKIL